MDFKEIRRICDKGLEIELAMLINSLGYIHYNADIFVDLVETKGPKASSSKHQERLRESKLKSIDSAYEMALNSVKRFDVITSEDYSKWLEFWFNLFRSFSEEELSNLDLAIRANDDLSDWIPDKSWKE